MAKLKKICKRELEDSRQLVGGYVEKLEVSKIIMNILESKGVSLKRVIKNGKVNYELDKVIK